MKKMSKVSESRLRKKINEYVINTMREREKNGVLKDQSDFLMGAGAVLQVLYPGRKNTLSPLVPAGWIFGIMANRDFLKKGK